MDEKITLAIESSCDETSAAILRGGRQVLSNIIATQIPVLFVTCVLNTPCTLINAPESSAIKIPII